MGQTNSRVPISLDLDLPLSRRYLVAPELALRYKVTAWWHLEGGYRFEYERDNEAVFQNRHRAAASTRFVNRLHPVTLGLRIQWQEKFRREQDDGTPQRHILRTRGKAKLRRVPWVSPYASLEMFRRLDGWDEDIPAGAVTKWRMAFGVEWQPGPIEPDLQYYRELPKHDPQEPSGDVLNVGTCFDIVP